jgi:hypothetical protein
MVRTPQMALAETFPLPPMPGWARLDDEDPAIAADEDREVDGEYAGIGVVEE